MSFMVAVVNVMELTLARRGSVKLQNTCEYSFAVCAQRGPGKIEKDFVSNLKHCVSWRVTIISIVERVCAKLPVPMLNFCEMLVPPKLFLAVTDTV